MRKLLLTLTLGWLVSATSGCVIDGFSGDPTLRAQESIYVSENLRLMQDQWERAWLLDQPSHITPYRTHGGLI
jgi:hypothetical protein